MLYIPVHREYIVNTAIFSFKLDSGNRVRQKIRVT